MHLASQQEFKEKHRMNKKETKVADFSHTTNKDLLAI